MQISNMVHELEIGVEKVTEKMQSMGIISNSLNGMESSETTGLSISKEANLMSDSDFIHCFRRDSNKKHWRANTDCVNLLNPAPLIFLLLCPSLNRPEST
ncbi:prolactin-like [Alligator mississippiensis]|uniref:Prolactin-like n=1 Tax=Alligator mississippiensis TaxID=8496 RepID=A0A151PEY3_ALLMI|nr:prolactin-like [Alligator mississippiensis]